METSGIPEARTLRWSKSAAAGRRSAGSRSAGRQRDRSAFFHPNHAPAAMLVRNACRVARKSSSTRWLATASAAMPPPLKGIKIVDLTRVLAGPYATASSPHPPIQTQYTSDHSSCVLQMMLSDLGAEVIKVERPGSGDDTRSCM